MSKSYREMTKQEKWCANFPIKAHAEIVRLRDDNAAHIALSHVAQGDIKRLQAELKLANAVVEAAKEVLKYPYDDCIGWEELDMALAAGRQHDPVLQQQGSTDG